MSWKKLTLVFAMLFIASLAIAACQPADAPEPEVVIQTVVVEKEGETIIETVVVTVEAETGMEETASGECCDTYRIALFEDPLSINYWAYLGPDSSVWTGYVLSGYTGSLFTLSDKRYDFVPSLAKEIPEIVDNGDETYSITVNMVEDAKWSDGEPITANDVVFTHNACKDLELTSNWPNQCNPNGADITAEAVGDFTVKYTYLNQAPSLGNWQAGIALAPILPEHFWGDVVAEAYTFVDAAVVPAEDDDCSAEEPSEACVAYSEAYENARRTLYEADAMGSPVAGGYLTDQVEKGAFVQRTANADYYFAGAEIVEYEDGTWMLVHPNGTTYQLYGDAMGEETLRYTSGPYSPNIIFSVYGSQDGAFLALANGEVDYVLNPLGLTRGLKEQALKGDNMRVYTNADYGMYYLAFNMRKEPMSFYEFRQAIDIVMDKEFVINNVLQGTVFPMYSAMPPGNGFWHNPEVPKPYVGMSRADRVAEAVRVLNEAGWTWTQDPAWSDDIEDVVPGEGLLMPNGEEMPELVILGPGPAYDPIRATFNQWISEWARELGMNVRSELTGFNTILGPVFVDASFDMYILGWSLGNVAFPDYFESFWHSRNDTAVSGNFNTPGFNNAEYDAIIDEFMSTSDLDRARELIFEAQVILADQRPYIPLYYKQTEDVMRANVVLPYTEVLGGIESNTGMQTDAQVLQTK